MSSTTMEPPVDDEITRKKELVIAFLSNLQLELRGIINERTIKDSQPNKKLIVFVSSTFTDTFKERNLLQGHILPELQKLGSENDVQVLFYDMRFGVKDESSLDHTTWQCCQEGIKECQEESDGIFFLSLQGDKYGYRPLPKLIDREFFEQALEAKKDQHELLEISQKWYRLNENHLPAKYELNYLRSTDDKEYWEVVLPRLRDELLHDFPFDAKTPELLIGRSITEWEVLFADRLKSGASVGIWIKKEFDPQSFLEVKTEDRPQDFNDSLQDPRIKERLIALKMKMSQSFDLVHPLPLQRLGMTDYVQDSEVCQDYLQKWELVVKHRFQEELEKHFEANQTWKELTTKQYGLPLYHLEEMLHHCFLAHQKASGFIGREELLEETLEAITATPVIDRSPAYSAITAAVIGQSGAGKTALLSKVATLIGTRLGGEGEEEIDLPIIIRHCGTSKFSLHGRDLIHSICLQLLAIYDQKSEIHQLLTLMTNQKYDEAVTYFGTLLHQYPVILLIDSVDQLSNRDEARSKLSFLRNLAIHPQSKIILSTLPDEYDERNRLWKYRYLCEKVLRTNHIPIVEMKHYRADDRMIRSLVEKLLARRDRAISEEQWVVVLKQASEEPTMLYLNLSLEIIMKWRSWETDVELRPTVKGLIHQIFEGLERYYGKALIQYAFGFICFSRDGISDQEMKDCLSLQSEVFEEVCQYWHGVTSIPLHVWLRVKQAIKALIAEKESGCLKWYHRQLWEAAHERYKPVQTGCHRVMGRYFSEQPLCLTDLDVWHPDSKINNRRVKEGYYHLYESGLYEETVTEMCSFEMVCASALNDDAYHALLYLSKLYRRKDMRQNQLLKHYYRWMRTAITNIMINPRMRISSTASEEPMVSIVKQENTRRWKECEMKIGELPRQYQNMDTVETLGTRKSFDNLQSTLVGHTDIVEVVSWSPDDSMIASGSADMTIKIWDSSTGELLTTLKGHENKVRDLTWHPDGSKIVSGSDDNTLQVWDSLTGEWMNTFISHEGGVASVSYSRDGSKVASGSTDRTIKIWDSVTGSLFATLEGHVGEVTSVSWNSEGDKIASGSDDTTIKIWDCITYEVLSTFEGHESRVSSISWDVNSSKLVSGSFDKTIRLWDVITGEMLSSFEGHLSRVRTVSWSPDNTRVASGSWDETIKIWDPITRELLATFRGHGSGITSVSWMSDGSKIASGSDDHTIKIWEATNFDKVTELDRHNRSVSSVCWNPDGTRMASGSWDKTIRLWDLSTGELINTLEGHSNRVTSVLWSPDGTKIASGSWDKTIKIWDAVTGEVIDTFDNHANRITSVLWQDDHLRIVSNSEEPKIQIWDMSTGEIQQTLEGHSSEVLLVSWNPDGSKIAAGLEDQSVMVWDSFTGEVLVTLVGHTGRISALAWSSDGRTLASGAEDATVKIWNVSTGEGIESLLGHSGRVSSLAWNGDDSKIVSGSDDKTINIWDLSTGERWIRTLEGHVSEITSVSWNPAGTKIASGSCDNTIKVWEYRRSEEE